MTSKGMNGLGKLRGTSGLIGMTGITGTVGIVGPGSTRTIGGGVYEGGVPDVDGGAVIIDWDIAAGIV